MSLSLNKLRKRVPLETVEKPKKKKLDRFDGLSEEDVQKLTLPDYLDTNLDMVLVGINPGLMSAHLGRYYAGPGNHFYKLLNESGLTPKCLSYEEDYKLLQYGIGLTNIVARATKSSAELKKAEIKEGSEIVREKLLRYKPKVAVFNGKCIYEIFAGKTSKSSFQFGLQSESIGETAVWVVPSSSARCANFPRMIDKLHFYTALKKYLMFLNGEITDVDTTEFSFDGKCKQFIPSTSKMWRRRNVSAFLHGGRVANKDTVKLDTSDENVAFVHSTEFIVKKIGYNEAKENGDTSDNVKGREDQEYSKNSTEHGNLIELSQSKEKLSQKIQRRLKDNIKSVNSMPQIMESKHSIRSNTVIRKKNNVDTSNTIHKRTTRNSKKSEAISAKHARVEKWQNLQKHNCNSPDFVHLIKERLSKKTNTENNE